MAKAKDLAALAGLAGLAYAMRNKGDKEDAGDQKTSSYAPTNNMTPMKGDDVATNESSYMPRNTMTPMQGVGDATNNPVAKSKTATTTRTPSTPVNPSVGSDKLANISRAVNREAKTKQFAQDTPEELSAQKTDALRVASRAAAKADSLRRAAKQSSYKSGGMTASSRADGIATKGKTRGKIC
jgi:hypothetical protein